MEPTQILTDTHAHLCDPIFDADRSEILKRAADAGVGAVILVSEDLPDAQRNMQLAASHSMLMPAAGLYPAILDLAQAEDLHLFVRQVADKLVAIGEVGLDHWVVKEEKQKALQRQIFKGFIELAAELDLPLNVHSRSAGRHAIAQLLHCGASRVQLHAFDGKFSAALPAVEAGYFFSIPPSVVRSRQKQRLVKNLPLSCLLVETDSPVLGPTPDERNEPANVRISIKAIAEIKGVHDTEVIEAVTENTRKLYGNLMQPVDLSSR